MYYKKSSIKYQKCCINHFLIIHTPFFVGLLQYLPKQCNIDDKSKIPIILASVSADWNKEDAAKVSDSLLKLYPDVDLIYAHNDRMAIGASEVAECLGLIDLKIISVYAAPEIGIKAVT